MAASVQSKKYKSCKYDIAAVNRAIVDTAKQLGVTSVKNEQLLAIRQFVCGNDVFVCLPTGYGKSLCYSCLPLVFDKLNYHKVATSIIIVVSPLMALMKDQIHS